MPKYSGLGIFSVTQRCAVIIYEKECFVESTIPDVFRYLWKPYAGRQSAAIWHGDPNVLDRICIVLEFCSDFHFMNRAMQQVPGLFRLWIKKSVNKVQIYEKIPEMF